LERLLRRGIDTKYKISLFKGMQMVSEALVTLLICISMLTRGDVFALIYLIFVIRMMTLNVKEGGKVRQHSKNLAVMARLCCYISAIILFTYLVTVLNLTDSSIPQPMPDSLEKYPLTYGMKEWDKEASGGKYAIPVFFKFDAFRELRICYLLGIGIQKSQMTNIYFDYLILFCASMHIMVYGNPLLQPSLEKVMWSFPMPHDSP
jgi:hypothetical protein